MVILEVNDCRKCPFRSRRIDEDECNLGAEYIHLPNGKLPPDCVLKGQAVQVAAP